MQSALRERVKHAIESGLVSSRISDFQRSRLRADTLVLAYHNVVPEGDPVTGDRSLHLPQAEFARQLDALGETHQVVGLADILQPGEGSRPRAVITFDDAYRGAVTAGVHELARRRMPATVFVAPAFLDGGDFWWDALAGPSGSVDPRVRDEALTRLQGRDGAIRAWGSQLGLSARPLPSSYQAAGSDDLQSALSTPGITLGSHTWSHPNLAALGEEELTRELADSLAWLRQRFTRVIPWLTYPYGLYSDRVAEVARATGYEGAFRIDGGWLRGPVANRFAIPRLNVPAGLSLRGFVVRASGLLCG